MDRDFRVVMQFVDGGVQDFDYEDGPEIIESWFGDDWGPPPSTLLLRAKCDDGRIVTISIPNDKRVGISASVSE